MDPLKDIEEGSKKFSVPAASVAGLGLGALALLAYFSLEPLFDTPLTTICTKTLYGQIVQAIPMTATECLDLFLSDQTWSPPR